MRIARVAYGGEVRWAVADDEHVGLLDRSPLEDISAHSVDRVPTEAVQFLAPVHPSKILAVGRNYPEHASEMGLEVGDEPSVFAKPPNTITGPGTDVVLPPATMTTEVEHEAELAVVIGRPTRDVEVEDVADYVLGYTCANDVTARDLQLRDNHVTRAKGFDTFCPLGPWIETSPDLDSLRVTCRVNGEIRQQGDVSEMTFNVPTIISSLSRWATLFPGDVVLTGSPPGRGSLHVQDRVEITVRGIGTLRHGVAAAGAVSP